MRQRDGGDLGLRGVALDQRTARQMEASEPEVALGAHAQKVLAGALERSFRNGKMTAKVGDIDGQKLSRGEVVLHSADQRGAPFSGARDWQRFGVREGTGPSR